MLQSFLSKLLKKEIGWRYSRTAAMGKTRKKCLFFSIICSRCCTRRNLCFHVENSQHADKEQLTRRYAFDLDIESTHGQPVSYRARPVNADDGPENLGWIRGLESEKLPAASYALLPNLKKGIFLPSERDQDFSSPVFYIAAPKCLLCQTPGRRPPRITARFVNTVTRGWVGAPNERAPFRFHGVVVGFVDRCL